MGYLSKSVLSVLPAQTVLLTVAYIFSQVVPSVNSKEVGTGGRQLESVVSELKKSVFAVGEQKDSLSTLDQIKVDDIYQEYALEDNCVKPQDCSEVKCCGNRRSGVYKVYKYGVADGYYVLCDLHSDKDGWTVIQRRQDGSVDFHRNWVDYERGFGQLNGEFWLGLSTIHDLLSQRPYELLIKLRDFIGGRAEAKYDWFYVSGPADKYRLQIGGFSGTAGDSLTLSNGMMFSAKDQDNDNYTYNCASLGGGGWHNACFHTKLNGVYCRMNAKDIETGYTCLSWKHWHNNFKPLQFVKMMVKPVGERSC